MTAEDGRRLALALPNTVVQDHDGHPSFRVAGKIFATLWDERTINVMVDDALYRMRAVFARKAR